MIRVAAALAPTFGGINLEDIKAPECFEIEEKLKARLRHPRLPRRSARHRHHHRRGADERAETGQQASQGSPHGHLRRGAAALSCAKLAMSVGIQQKNIVLVDTTGVVYAGRTRE